MTSDLATGNYFQFFGARKTFTVLRKLLPKRCARYRANKKRFSFQGA